MIDPRAGPCVLLVSIPVQPVEREIDGQGVIRDIKGTLIFDTHAGVVPRIDQGGAGIGIRPRRVVGTISTVDQVAAAGRPGGVRIVVSRVTERRPTIQTGGKIAGVDHPARHIRAADVRAWRGQVGRLNAIVGEIGQPAGSILRGYRDDGGRGVGCRIGRVEVVVLSVIAGSDHAKDLHGRNLIECPGLQGAVGASTQAEIDHLATVIDRRCYRGEHIGNGIAARLELRLPAPAELIENTITPDFHAIGDTRDALPVSDGSGDDT